MNPTVVFSGPTPAHIYRDQLGYVMDGQEVEVSGRPTRERLDVVTQIWQPLHHITTVPGRRLNPWIALSESLWLLAGRDDVAALLPYNKNILRFSDDGKTMYGAYGKRIMPQIPGIIERLRANPTDRRAVVAIWEECDLTAETKDPPCNDLVFFKLRQDMLYMTVTCRSNDIHWGLQAVNLPQFGVLQEFVASFLGAGVGTQTHVSNSLHAYTDPEAAKITDRMEEYAGNEIVTVPFHPLFPEQPASTVRVFSQAASEVLDDEYEGYLDSPFLLFAQEYLRVYREKTWEKLDSCAYAGLFQDWIAAAGIWRMEGEMI